MLVLLVGTRRSRPLRYLSYISGRERVYFRIGVDSFLSTSVRKLGATIPGGSGFIFESDLISFREAMWYDTFWFQKVMLDVLTVYDL